MEELLESTKMEEFLTDAIGVNSANKRYVSILRKESIKGVKDLEWLKDEDYTSLGFKLLHKRKIMKAVQLKFEPSTAPPSAIMLEEIKLEAKEEIKLEAKESPVEKKGLSEENEKTLLELQKKLSILFLPKRLSELTAFVRSNIDNGITLAALKLVHDNADFLTELLITNVDSQESELSKKQVTFDTFLSHVQQYAGDLCRILQLELRPIGINVWLDMIAERLDSRGMIEGVNLSTYFTLVMTKGYFERPYPVFEVLVANILNKPIMVLREEDERFGGLTHAEFVSALPKPWITLLSHEILTVKRRGAFWTATIEELKKRLSKKPGVKNYIDRDRKREFISRMVAEKEKLPTLWLLPSRVLHEMPGHRQPVTCVRFHPKFTWVVSSSDDSSIRLWDWESGKFIRSLRGHTSAVMDLDFDTEGERLASCSADCSIKLWSMTDDNFKCLRTLQGHDHYVTGVRFLSDRLISCSRDTTINIWDIKSGCCLETLEGHEEWVKCISVSACGSMIASGSMDKSVRVSSQINGSWHCTKIFNDHDHVVECVEFSNYSADKVLTSSEDRKEDIDIDEDGPPQARFLASGSRDRTIRVYDLKVVKCIMILKGHENWVRSLQWHPAGKYLVTCADDKCIRVWDLATRQEETGKRIEKAHKMFVQTLHYSRTAAVVVTGGADNVVKVWECEQ